MTNDRIAEILDRPLSRELLARDICRLAYVAKEGTPRTIPIAFTWNGAEIVMCTSRNAPKLASLEMNGSYQMTAEQRVEWEAEVRSLYDGMVRIVLTPTWAKLIDFETTLPSAVEELIRQRADRH
jgi:hypothetical protein